MHHCASQGYNGIVSIFMFYNNYNVLYTTQDLKGATALHFAVIGLQFKNV